MQIIPGMGACPTILRVYIIFQKMYLIGSCFVVFCCALESIALSIPSIHCNRNHHTFSQVPVNQTWRIRMNTINERTIISDMILDKLHKSMYVLYVWHCTYWNGYGHDVHPMFKSNGSYFTMTKKRFSNHRMWLRFAPNQNINVRILHSNVKAYSFSNAHKRT